MTDRESSCCASNPPGLGGRKTALHGADVHALQGAERQLRCTAGTIHVVTYCNPLLWVMRDASDGGCVKTGCGL